MKIKALIFFTELFLIVEELLKKLKTDLDIDEKITSQATKTFFTFQEDNLKSCLLTVEVLY